MKINDYINENKIFIIINIVVYVLMAICMKLLGVHPIWIIIIFLIWFMPIAILLLINYTKKINYYNLLMEVEKNLDKKYLLSEVIDEPEFLEGKIIYDILKNIKDDTHETLNYYKENQVDYRDYVEIWIHEIKTPIASTKLIIENNKNEVTNNILNEVNKVEDFIEQALYYSKSNHTSKDYIVKEFNIGDVIKSSIRKNSRDFIYKDIKINLEGIDEYVFTDNKWITFILNQLLSNSIKYSKDEDASITISTKRYENNLVLTIEDNGVGISAYDVDRVFEKGFTGDNGRLYGKSTGMGLYICKKLADKLGLGIKLSSKESIGTKVDIVFPLGKITLFES